MSTTTTSSARVHSHQSNRATTSKVKVDDKIAFRGVLANPYEVKWPVLPHNTQIGIIAHVVKLLAGVSEYTVGRRLQSRKRKRAIRSASTDMTKRLRLVPDGCLGDKHNPLASESECGPVTANDMKPSSSISLAPPAVYAHLSVGINEVTKSLELLATQTRPRRILDSSGADTSQAAVQSRIPVQVVLVCLHDLDSPAMTAHLPQLVAACNSARRLSTTENHQPVKLVPLPKGTEGTLANALGLRHASALAFDADTPSINDLLELLRHVPALTAPWLVPSTPTGGLLSQRRYELTHVKQLRTTAPKDMKTAKESRIRGKAEAKLRRKILGIITKKRRKSGASKGKGSSAQCTSKLPKL